MTDERPNFLTHVEQVSDDAWRVELVNNLAAERHVVELREERDPDGKLFLATTHVGVSSDLVRAHDLRRAADRLERLEDHARSAVLAVREGETIQPPGVRRHRKLTDDFLASVVRRHEQLREAGRPPTAALAAEQGVTPGAVKNWLRKARERGIEGRRFTTEIHHR
jgi:hypothetical protein